jgi:hypothetical protein
VKKSKKRNNSKYPALDPSLNLKSRQHLISDCDYLHKLDEETKAYLNKFNEEYVNASFDHDDPLHNTPELKKDCTDRNNARNRDLYLKKEMTYKLVRTDEKKREKD